MADIDFKNGVNVDTAFVDGHKVKLIAVLDGNLELPISANDEYGYVVDANGKKHRVLLVTFLAGDPDFKSSPNADTAYMTVNSQKVKVRLGAKLNGAQYLSDSANVNDCYTEDDDGNKHRTILVSEPTGTLELPTSETNDSAYVIDGDGNKHKVRLFAVLAGGTTIVEVTVSGVPPLNLLGAVEDSLSSVKAFGGLLQSGVPSGYTAVEYIEATGTQYIDTGVKSNSNSKTEVGFTIKGWAGAVFGNYAENNDVGKSNTLYVADSSSKKIYTTDKGSAIGADIDKTLLGVGVLDASYVAIVDWKNKKASLDGVEVSLVSTTVWQGTHNQVLFARTAANGDVGYFGKFQISYCKIWDDGVLVRDFIPAIRNSDSVVGMYDTVSGTFYTNAGTGTFTAGNEITPTPSDPLDLVCNNGALKVLDKTQWTYITNPTPSQPNAGVFIDSTGLWKTASDRGAGVVIPLTIGKQYTLLIHKKTQTLGTLLRYGQSPQATPTAVGVQLTDWYRGEISDGQIVSFVAKQPYFVMQLSAAAAEAGMMQEAIEVLEAQGGDYTMLEYLVADGNSWVETNLSGVTRWVGAGQATSESTGSKCILGALTSSGNASVYLASRFGSSTDARNKRWTIDGASGATSVSGLTYAKYDIDYQENTFTGTINAESTSRTNTDTFTTWLIGSSRGVSGGVTTNYPFVGNIYRQQAYQNNVLVGDFIPAKRNSDNVVGMYDTVSGTFFTNAGTGVFVAGTPLGDGEVLKLTPSNDTAGVANLLKIDNYVDTQEILTGVINHQLGIYVFDGTEDWTWTNNANAPARLNIPELDYVLNEDVAPVMCSHFMPTYWNNLTAQTKTIPYVAANQTTQTTAKRLVFTTAWDANITDLESWKTFLATQYTAGTPVIVVYGLGTPQDEVAPVPQTMQVVAGDNTLDIVQAGMSGLEVSATYMKGVSVTINEIEDANIGNSVEVVIA